MRKVTQKAIQNFNNSKNFKSGNTEVETTKNGLTFLILHGNTIAIKDENGKIQITNCGWFSNTTKERLNAIDGVNIYQKNWNWYLNGKIWDGNLIEIA